MKKKILMFGWEFPPHNSGGLGVACQGIAEALAQRDFELIFVLPTPANLSHEKIKFNFPESNKKIVFEYIESSLDPYQPYQKVEKILYQNIRPNYKSLIDEVLDYEIKAEEITLRTDFDIIHAHDWLSFGAGIRAKKISGKPLIAHIHATEIDRAGEFPNQFIYQKEKEGFQQADKIIAVSEFTKNTVVRYYGINPDKITVVHNGINVEESTSTKKPEKLAHFKSNGKKLVLFLGRLTIQKNPVVFIESAKIVKKVFPDVAFIFAGSGDMERELMGKTAEYGLSDTIYFSGFVRGEEKFDLFKQADLFVMPSIAEPFGLVALEAVLNETPVLISKQSGVSEALNHALKVDFWDVKEMANQIVTVLKYSSLGKTLVEHSMKEAKNISWEKAVDKIIEIYSLH